MCYGDSKKLVFQTALDHWNMSPGAIWISDIQYMPFKYQSGEALTQWVNRGLENEAGMNFLLSSAMWLGNFMLKIFLLRLPGWTSYFP